MTSPDVGNPTFENDLCIVKCIMSHQNSSSPDSITVSCPSCGHEFPLSSAVLKSVRANLAQELTGDIQRREASISERQRLVREKETALKEQRSALDTELEKRVQAALGEREAALSEKIRKEAAEATALEVKSLEEELSEKRSALKSAREQELLLLKEKRQLQEAREQLSLDLERKLDEERGKLKAELRAQADQENHLKIAQKEKLISDLKEKLEAAQRQAEQGSQQAQGEILEVDFEQQLRQAFPVDRIAEVPKGVSGADVSMEVISSTGKSCGTILFETKRTRNWSDAWIGKLKQELVNARADLGVIVSETLPMGVECCDLRNGIWICSPIFALSLTRALRRGLHDLLIAKGNLDGAREKTEVLYAYLTGNEFRQRIETIIHSFNSLKEDLDKERRALTKYWAKREKQIQLVVDNMAGMVGDVQAISGNALQNLPALELEESA